MNPWREFKYWIADNFFEYELDEAFRLGVGEGKRHQASQIRVEMEYKKARAQETGLTKTQAVGWDRCMEVVKDVIN